MSWTLEAGFALAAIILTLTLSGLGLLLKHRKGLINSNATVVEGTTIFLVAFAHF
jgi:hypothetical protein